MGELTNAETIRITAINLAANLLGKEVRRPYPLDELTSAATRIEKFIKEGGKD